MRRRFKRHGVVCYLIKKYRITISIRKLSCNFVDFPIACNKYKYNEDEEFFKTFGAALLAFFVGTVLMWFVLFSIIGGIAASFGQRQVYVPSDAVLVVVFSFRNS